MVPARGLASSPALTFSPNGSGIYFFQMRVKIAAGQESFAKEFSILVLAGAGGFEPPNGGIKTFQTSLIYKGFLPYVAVMLHSFSTERLESKGSAWDETAEIGKGDPGCWSLRDGARPGFF
jgi:hypothetical protein